MKHSYLAPVFSLGFLSLVCGAQVDVSPSAARISFVQGDVWVQRGDTGDWSSAALNQPVVGGDRISTGDNPNSKVELQLDHGNILRLGNNSRAKIATVERAPNQRPQIQVQIGQGIAYYTVFKDSEAEVEIDTPNAAIRPISKDGVYRIEATGFETQVIVRAGAVDLSTPQGDARVDMGEGATIRGTNRVAGNVLGGAPGIDSWDSWNIERDGVIRNAQSWNYTNRFYVGSEDLDAYGQWVSVPDYGRVWSPTVGKGWAPYRTGRWVWEPYWGWTWVSQEPWGWTPYHYGRWFLYGKSWMWWPGPGDGQGSYHPEWSPGYVSFFGFGGHRGDPVGFKSVGWLPLGPGDSFYPWYGGNGSPVKQGGVTNATDITRLIPVVAPLRDDNEFANVSLAAGDGKVRDAISSVPVDRFGTGRSAPKGVSRRAFRDARVITGSLPIIPTREMLMATKRATSAPSKLSAAWQDRYFTKRQPAARPRSFDEEAAQLQESLRGFGQLVQVREVTQLDSADTAQPPAMEKSERTVAPARDAPIEDRSESQSQSAAGSRASHSPRLSKSTGRIAKTPPPAHRDAKTHAESRTERNAHSAPPRVPAASSASRATVAASRATASHAAQNYIDSANRQMDKGNYNAAIANYKRALQLDGNNSTAKSRMGRARRAMQAENEILANRR